MFWPKLVKRVFPFAPKQKQYRKALFDCFERVRHLRNRAFHHEPLWKGLNLNGTNYPIEVLHQEVRQLLSWLSPELDSLLQKVDRFETVSQKFKK